MYIIESCCIGPVLCDITGYMGVGAIGGNGEACSAGFGVARHIPLKAMYLSLDWVD
jgi:hypothetical protein